MADPGHRFTRRDRRPVRIIVCQTMRYGTTAPCCLARGGAQVLAALRQRIVAEGLAAVCAVEEGPCLNHCAQGPTLRLVGRDFFTGMSPDTLDAVVGAVRRALAEGSGEYTTS